MINLLADTRKATITAARANTIITRYIAIILLALAFMGGALYVSYTLLQNTMQSATSLIESNDVKAEVYNDTEQQVTALSGQLTEAKDILNQEVRYSQVLVKIGQLMPEGAVLANLSLSNTAFTGAAIEVKAYARSASEASALQARLQSSPLFSQVSLKGTDTSGGIDGYPVVVTLNVGMNRAGI